jgi:hypothetical protein
MLKAYIVIILKTLGTTMDILKGQIITGIYYCFQWAGKKHFKADGKFNRLCTNYRLKCLSHHFFLLADRTKLPQSYKAGMRCKRT